MDRCYKNRGARASFTSVLNDSLVHLRLWGLPMPTFIGQAILLCFILLLATPTWAQAQDLRPYRLGSLAKRPIVTSSALRHSIPPAELVWGNSCIHPSTSSLADSLVQCNRSVRLTIAPSMTSGLMVLKRTASQTLWHRDSDRQDHRASEPGDRMR